MASRATIKTWLYNFLGTSSDDPAYTDAIIEPIIQSACDAIVADEQDQNPSYLSTTVTLSAVSSTSHDYNLASQASDFAKWLEVRYTDYKGALFRECRTEELYAAGDGYFAITGIDSAAVLTTSADATTGKALWMRYQTWPADMTDDADVPGGIPLKYHDVIALECLFAFGLGGESRWPKELYDRWFDRRNQLMSRVGRRGVQPTRVRHDQYTEEW
jgi:hypothetical protein